MLIVRLNLEIIAKDQKKVMYPLYRGDWLKASTFLEDSISRSTHTNYTGTVSTCTWSPFLPCCRWKVLIQMILTSIRTAKEHDFVRSIFLGTSRRNRKLEYQVQEFKILGSECQTSGTCAKRAKQATKKDNAAACLNFLNYLAFLRPAADRAVSILPWVVSPCRSYGFLWAVRLFKNMW
jgi:hypothetical protein